MDIRQILIDEMERQRLSQRRLAQQTGIMQPRISDYLRGKRDVQADTLRRMLEALELEIQPKKGN